MSINKNIMLRITELAFDIGESSRHYATISVDTSRRAFTVAVYIHSQGDNGISAGIVDSRYFSCDSSYITHRDWLTGWKAIVETERKEDDEKAKKEDKKNEIDER